ncbi:PEP-CTERM sorting domain-containing protein [Paraglaciecola sp. 20A4]|uniref:PEP-CTERM sorting domain-containing protein n=1 Tax=Paraglaciecola sp. 20A4 TaxID=2687288 RepID=UPI001407E287|nr:PEP-CTERM sorting domain-containing protein [Paraglaciecola sp. 20A4]
MNIYNSKLTLCAIATLSAISFTSTAALTPSYSFNGNGNWSLDGCGSNSTPTCSIDAVVPTGSTIEAAFLYSTGTPNSAIPTVNFDGTTFSGADWTSLGANNAFLEAYRVDVTSLVSAAVGGGSAAPFSFDILSENPTNSIDGEALAIVYSNPAETLRSIAFLDGFSQTTGDSAFISLADPLTAADLATPGFEATLSLGIGYGFQSTNNTQSSIVNINGNSLTTCAGGQNDGFASNGGLITIGGIGDDRANNHDCSLSNGDDELYSLEPFLNVGDSLVTIDTQNPSDNDNIFFAGLSITAEASIDNKPVDPNPVPEPGTLAIFGIALLSMGRKARGMLLSK